MKIRYRWHGALDALPMIGQLVASERGRNAYRILAVDDRGGHYHLETRETFELLVLTVERAPRAEMDSAGSVTHSIVWDKRAKTARRFGSAFRRRATPPAAPDAGARR